MTIYYDMDGTIADFYGTPDWRERLEAEDISPYTDAGLLVDAAELQLYLSILQSRGHSLGVISWTAKDASEAYEEAIRQAKIEWLRTMLPKIHFDEVHIVKYGTRKDFVATDKDGIIFDDDEKVRKDWKGIAINPNTEDIIEVLKKIKEMTE